LVATADPPAPIMTVPTAPKVVPTRAAAGIRTTLHRTADLTLIGVISTPLEKAARVDHASRRDRVLTSTIARSQPIFWHQGLNPFRRWKKATLKTHLLFRISMKTRRYRLRPSQNLSGP